MNDATSQRERPTAGAAFEASDARARPLLLFGLGLAALIVVTLLLCAWLARLWTAREAEPHPMQAFREPPSEPLLQAIPTAELEQHEREVSERLNTYGWIDEPGGIVHVPIERALELVSERGLPEMPEPSGESDR